MDLTSKLPYFYNNPITSSIQNAYGIEADILNEEVEDTLNQFFVDKATWGLDLWEEMLRIPKNNLDIQTRRENIKAKRRSKGTTTEKFIKNICEAYSNGEVNVIMHKEEQYFELKFIGSIGIPAGFNEMDNMIESLKPCHLGHKYIFAYITWDMFDKYNFIFDELDNKNLTWDELEVYEKEGVK